MRYVILNNMQWVNGRDMRAEYEKGCKRYIVIAKTKYFPVCDVRQVLQGNKIDFVLVPSVNHDVNGYTMAELGEIMRMSEENVEKCLQRIFLLHDVNGVKSLYYSYQGKGYAKYGVNNGKVELRWTNKGVTMVKEMLLANRRILLDISPI